MRLIGIFGDTIDTVRHLEAFLTTDVLANAGETRLERIAEASPERPLTLYSDPKAYPPIDSHTAPSGSFTVVDGELYNPEVFGVSTLSEPPQLAALFGKAFEDRGLDALKRVDSAALVSHYDAATDTLTVARDVVGSVPVFYLEKPGALLFAADLLSLLPFVSDREIEPAALDYFMASGYIPAPWTMVKGIHRLPPGTAIVRKRGQTTEFVEYDRFTGNPPLNLSEDEIVERFADLFPKAVERRITDFDKTGILLSAGVDSKVIAAVAHQIYGRAPKSFTFHYVGHDGDLNEATLAKACADHTGSEHHVIPFEPTDLPAMLPRVIHNFGEPFSYGLHTAVLSVVRDFGVQDLLCGTGADGWFAGFQEINARKYMRQNAVTRFGLRAFTRATQAGESMMRAAGLPGQLPALSRLAHNFHTGIWTAHRGLTFYTSAFITPHWLRRELYIDPKTGDVGRDKKRHMQDEILATFEHETPIARGKIICTRFYGADSMQNWNHWSARAVGASIRAPFYDRDLMDLISRLPLDRPRKQELRKFAATMMPHDMAFTKKVAQSVPLTDWLHGPLRGFVEDSLASDTFKSGGIFDPKKAQKHWHRQPAGVHNIDWVFWNMIVLSEWQKLFGVSAPRRDAA